ncbi:MAG: helix-turn-helix domain-containing protein [Armatimonadota bacterium]|nr:TetR/AcrR family transcriptional regulator [bacterium]
MANDKHRDESRSSTYEALIAAAMDILDEKGYLGTTTREIAARAGFTEVTLYRHFRSKDELLSAGINRQAQKMLDLLFEPTGNLEQDLLALAKGLSVTLSSDIDHIISLLPELSRYPVLLSGDALRIMQSFDDGLAKFFRYYQQTGELKENNIDQIVRTFAGPMLTNMLFSKVINTSVEFDYELYVKRFLAGYRKT